MSGEYNVEPPKTDDVWRGMWIEPNAIGVGKLASKTKTLQVITLGESDMNDWLRENRSLGVTDIKVNFDNNKVIYTAIYGVWEEEE